MQTADKKQIKFGTDGWRAIISEDFTFENVRWITQAIAEVLLEERGKDLTMVIGHDTRFLSREYAVAAAEVLAGNGIKVHLSHQYAPTPITSFMIKNLNATGGIVVTASHNPPQFNGIKFKDYYGGPGSPEITERFEAKLPHASVKSLDLKQAMDAGLIKITDFDQAYRNFLETFLDFNLIRSSKFKVIVDSMYGAGQGYFESLLGKDFQGEISSLHGSYNPGFEGVNPEPIEKNLKQLVARCQKEKALGLATDGDADRIGVVDENGEFVYSHQLIALFVLYLRESRGWSGGVAKSISTTALINKIAQEENFPVYETPIGFKHICTLMQEKDILIGGEESGGIGFKNHVPERDGLLAGLLVIEMLAYYKCTLVQLIEKMDQRFGKLYYQRIDVHYDKSQMSRFTQGLAQLAQKEILGQKVVETKTEDGIKQIMEDQSWLLIRASGTEPTLRIYAESKSAQRVQQLLDEGQKIAFA